MTSEVPVTQARDELADLINRVAYGHERIILTRHSKPVACIVPPEDLERLEQEGGGQERINLTSAGPEPVVRQLPAAPAPGPRPAAPAPGPMPVAAQHRPQSRI
jgi:prevent-host-death family protein